MTGMVDVNAIVRDIMERRNAAIEEACERMLVSSDPVGVLVEEWPDGRFRVSLSADVEPYVVTTHEHDGPSLGAFGFGYDTPGEGA